MSKRRSVAEVLKELHTTSDKIRALATAGYDRVEIADILGIRYQHVRNVLVRSGISGGLRREVKAEREPVEVNAEPAAREDTSWKVLTDAGFQFLGEWTHDPDSLLKLDFPIQSDPGVYAFVVDDVVVYVGLTLSGLKTRLDQYRRGHIGQRTSSRINGKISQTLHEGKKVKVLVATPEPQEWQELPVNTAAGLEAGLIEMIAHYGISKDLDERAPRCSVTLSLDAAHRSQQRNVTAGQRLLVQSKAVLRQLL
jgi:hypothetical protein